MAGRGHILLFGYPFKPMRNIARRIQNMLKGTAVIDVSFLDAFCKELSDVSASASDTAWMGNSPVDRHSEESF